MLDINLEDTPVTDFKIEQYWKSIFNPGRS